MGRSPEILAPCPRGEQGGRVFQSGLDPRAHNKCQRKEGWGVPGPGPRGPDRPLPRKLTLILKCGHLGAPARRRLRPPPGDTPTRARSSLALSPSSRALSGWRSLHLLSSSFCSLPSLSLHSLSFSYLVLKTGKAE